jgi:hypothetical protein
MHLTPDISFEQVWQKATGVNWNQVSDRIEGRDYLVSLAVVSVVALQYHSEEIASLPFTRAVATGRSNWPRISKSSLRNKSP